jgi:serine/threonine-protein kinase
MDGVPVKVGDLVADKYRIERVLGEGAMGLVVAARHVDIDRLVALKFIKPQRGAMEEQIARVFREAKAAAKLQSEHAGKVLDVGKLEGGVPYIVMELLAGKDLAAVLRELYVVQAAHAIAEAHTFGIVHRDLKPANIFLTYGPADEPIVKVLDFGISKLGADEGALTRTGEMLGSPAYMSPEQVKCSHEVDGRSDVWALAVTLYELLAGPGVTPFPGKTTYELMMRITQEPPIPLTKHRPDLPPGLVAAIMACLAEKDPSRRYRSVAAFVSALAPYVPASAAIYVPRIATIQFEDVQPARPTAEPPRHGNAGSAGVVSAGTAPAGSPASTGTARKLGVIALIGAASVALVGAGIGFARWRSTTDVRPHDVGPAVPGPATSIVVPPPPSAPSADSAPAATGSVVVAPSIPLPQSPGSSSASSTAAPGPSTTAPARHVAHGPAGHPTPQGTGAPRTTYDSRD